MIGSHHSNRFRIVLRDIGEKMDVMEGLYLFPNYFDTQRVKLTSAIMGELFHNLKVRESKSVETFLRRIENLPLSMKKADSSVRWACRLLEENGESGIRTLMERLTKQDKKEYLASLSCCVWNYMLSEFLKEKENSAVEILLKDNTLGTIVLPKNTSRNETIKSEQTGFTGKFIERNALAEARVEKAEWRKEGQRFSCTIELELPKGSYATLFLKWLFAMEAFRN